eukprot:PITA_20929
MVQDGLKQKALLKIRKSRQGDNDKRGAKTVVSSHTERRLHQMMFANRDYERAHNGGAEPRSDQLRPVVTLQNCVEKGYSVVNVKCKDRPKLLFETVCTLTDMQYVVFHGTVDAEGPDAYQGLRLELCSGDRVGLLSDVTQIFHENGLLVTGAEVSTRGDKALNVFYVTDAAGNPVNAKTIEAVRSEIGQTILQVKESSIYSKSPPEETGGKFSLGNLFRSSSERFLHNLGFIKSPS